MLVSCSTTPKVTGGSKAEVLYKQAEAYSKRKRYFLATEKLNDLRSKFPYSYYATPAELMTADILYKQKSYIEATASYLAFRDLHPKSKRMDYVLYMIGQSYFKQIPNGIDRDLTFAKQSRIYFNELLKRFPDSNYRKEVELKNAQAAKMLWQREQYVADFYFKTKNYEAAQFRYLDILKSFQGEKELINHAQARIVKSSFNLGNYRNCLNYLKQFATSFSESVAKSMTGYAQKCGDKITENLKASKEG